MKNVQNKLVLVLLIILVFPFLSNGQNGLDNELRYQVNRHRPYISVSREKIISKSDMFNQEQKDLMNLADLGKDIEVKVKYMPENTLKHNDIKEFDFRFIPEPENEATYAGGQKELIQYLKVNAMDKVSGVFDKSILAAEYASSLRVKQDFVLLVGNMESCTLNLINIR